MYVCIICHPTLTTTCAKTAQKERGQQL